jgi:lipoprotein signal peptidase
MMRPFQPLPASTKNIVVGASTANVQITNAPGNVMQVRVVNNGTATAWIEFGDSTITASLTTSIPIGAGVVEVLTVQCPATPLYAAAIAAGATGNVYFTPGVGL